MIECDPDTVRGLQNRHVGEGGSCRHFVHLAAGRNRLVHFAAIQVQSATI
jgi:hypothetical protein